MSKGKELANVVSEETMIALQESYPVEQNGQRIILPRLGLVSQDVTEGKGKQMKVITEAGTFFTEKPSDEEDPDTGKRIYKREELGNEIEGVILFKRYQLKMYHENDDTFTSSPVFDNEEEIVPIFKNKEEVGRGTVKELQAKYEFTDSNTGKIRSKLELNRILYVQYEDEIYQMNLRGTSMFAFLAYARKVLVPSVVTTFSSEAKEKGSINWNQMTFNVKRKLTEKEAQEILQKVQEIKRAIEFERAQFSGNVIRGEVVESAAEKEYKKF